MAYRSGLRQNYSYLTDGDGFPTQTIYDYWRFYGYSPSTLKSMGIRSLAEMTVESGSWYPYYNLPYPHWDHDNYDVSSWNNARSGIFAKGKVNYIPLLAEEAMQIYWRYRGFQIFAPQLTVSQRGSKCSIQPRLDNDEGGYFIPPENRIWDSRGFGHIPYILYDSFSEVFHEDRYGNKSSHSGHVDFESQVMPPYNQLIRFGLEGASYKYGFEQLGNVAVGEGYGFGNDADIHDQGHRSALTEIFLTSMFYWRDISDIDSLNLDQGEYIRKTTVTPKKVTLMGVPLIQVKRETEQSQYGLLNTARAPVCDFTDIYLESG